MAPFRKSYAYLIFALSLLMVLQACRQPETGFSTAVNFSTTTTQPSFFSEIALRDSSSELFKLYNTNGTAPSVTGNSIVLYGSNNTNMYSDVVSLTTIEAEKTLVLEAEVSANINIVSNTGEDQFAIFAADDTVRFKGDEFGFVLPETGNTWYAYIQSPQIQKFYIWGPVLTLETLGLIQHNFKAVYTSSESFNSVSFYVDGKLQYKTLFPDVSGQNFNMIICSHKVSADNIDTSQNKIEANNAHFWNASELCSYPDIE